MNQQMRAIRLTVTSSVVQLRFTLQAGALAWGPSGCIEFIDGSMAVVSTTRHLPVSGCQHCGTSTQRQPVCRKSRFASICATGSGKGLDVGT